MSAPFNKLYNQSMVKQFITWYSIKLQTHPFTTKGITSGLIAGAGDLTCQFIIQKQNFQKNTLHRLTEEVQHDHNIQDGVVSPSSLSVAKTDNGDEDDLSDFSFKPDLIRTSRFGFLGFALISPVIHIWYGTLMRKIPGNSLKAVLQRTILDQLICAPLMVPTFMTSVMLLESKSMDHIQRTLSNDLGDVIISNWALWTPAIFFNFKYVPGPWQVLFSNCVGFVWNVYLSWKTQEGASDVHDME